LVELDQLEQLAQMEQVEQLDQRLMQATLHGPVNTGVTFRAPTAAPTLQAGDFQPPLTTQLLVLQPTPMCNISCSYCYLPERSNPARMTVATAATAARRLAEDGLAGAELTVVWHAGEPLLMPHSFYDDAIAAIGQALPATRVQHALQTNAMLIDESWCALFRRHGIAVGVSVDGPAHLHDAHRRTRHGGGTHAQVMRGLAQLRAADVPFHAIAVVSAATLPEPDAFYDWFEAQGIQQLGCNFDEAEGVNTASSLKGHEAAHAAFLQRLLQRAERGGVQVRELDAAWRAVQQPAVRWTWRGQAFPANTQVQPLALLTVQHDGAWCSFSPELAGQRSTQHGDFVLGHVQQAGYLAALATPRLQALWGEIVAGVQACAERCAYFDHCGGGAPANKFYEHGHFAGTETLYCRSMLQRPFDAVLARAEQQLGMAT
jgi:uncharacterized protein